MGTGVLYPSWVYPRVTHNIHSFESTKYDCTNSKASGGVTITVVMPLVMPVPLTIVVIIVPLTLILIVLSLSLLSCHPHCVKKCCKSVVQVYQKRVVKVW